MAMLKSPSLFSDYPVNGAALDEVFANVGNCRDYYKKLVGHFSKLGDNDYSLLHNYAKNASFSQGITFNVYSGNAQGAEKIFPFDLFPRIIPKKEWKVLEKGVVQRNRALNLFLKDIYHEKHFLKDGLIPKELLYDPDLYCKWMEDFSPPGDTYTHICGTDIILHSDGNFYVLEDNLRCPSGISYVLSNRETMKKALPNLFFKYQVKPVDQYPMKLREMMEDLAPAIGEDPICVLLSPGMYNSAYYEHVFLASRSGIPLVEGRDLFVEQDFVYMRTIHGAKRVSVIYRRIDDDFLDPEVFRKDSLLGVKGLMKAYLKGNVTLMNAPGNGVADDKAIYTFVPDIIKYYLGEEPILKNVETYRCVDEKDCKFVVENLNKLVVKPVDGSGGYGILLGHLASKQELDDYRRSILKNPRKYIAQPVMSLSMHATFVEDSHLFEPRHIDLRVFSIVNGDQMYVCQGGLTRVALKRGSLIVNSSQGGGAKDTWVLEA